MFLPQKWKDSNVSRDDREVKMDPNLTLAHITHNTSMILLHQHLAYPPAEWGEIMKLPSSCSAETCQLAAVETASIAEKYLRYTDGILTSQFAFCAFVAARVFLGKLRTLNVNLDRGSPSTVHWLFYDTNLAPEFDILVNSLEKMSERWQGTENCAADLRQSQDSAQRELDMAARYASQLRELREKCQDDSKFYLKILGYSETAQGLSRQASGFTPSSFALAPLGSLSGRLLPASTKEPSKPSYLSTYEQPGSTTFYQQRMMNSPSSMSGLADGPPAYMPNASAMPPLSRNQSRGYRPQEINTSPPIIDLPMGHMGTNMSDSGSASGLVGSNSGEDVLQDELSIMSQLLLGQQFLELDRVITLEGTDFDFNVNNWGNLH